MGDIFNGAPVPCTLFLCADPFNTMVWGYMQGTACVRPLKYLVLRLFTSSYLCNALQYWVLKLPVRTPLIQGSEVLYKTVDTFNTGFWVCVQGAASVHTISTGFWDCVMRKCLCGPLQHGVQWWTTMSCFCTPLQCQILRFCSKSCLCTHLQYQVLRLCCKKLLGWMDSSKTGF